MKASIFFALGLIIVAFSSCKKKEYICECQGGFSGGGATILIEKATKGNAQAECIVIITVLTLTMDFIIAN